MSALSLSEIDRIALLARLALTDAEKARFADQLGAVLEYADKLSSIDVTGIEPTATVIPARSVMRSGDSAGGQLARKDALANAPQSDGTSFEVQATFGNDD